MAQMRIPLGPAHHRLSRSIEELVAEGHDGEYSDSDDDDDEVTI